MSETNDTTSIVITTIELDITASMPVTDRVSPPPPPQTEDK